MTPVFTRFRLALRRTLFFGGIALAVFIIWLGSGAFREYRTQQHVAAELRSRDLWFEYEEGAVNRWLREHVGIIRPLFPSAKITRIEDDWVMSRKTHRVFTDADVPWLTSFHTLIELDVHRSMLSDEAIRQVLGAHPLLESLTIGESSTPKVLKDIGSLIHLEKLIICGPWVYNSDDGGPWFKKPELWQLRNYPKTVRVRATKEYNPTDYRTFPEIHDLLKSNNCTIDF